MSEPKAFASLSSGLLARKGAARPAMKPQGFGQMGNGLDDLGWNDMGFEPPKPSLAPVRDLDHDGFGEAVPTPPLRNPVAGLSPVSPVHHQHAEIAERLADPGPDGDAEFDETAELVGADAPSIAEIVQLPTPVVQAAAPAPRRAPRVRSAPGAKPKAAFTLRLDPDRHLKLRLACAVSAVSAQQLVTQALDHLLASMPELEAMAQRAPDKAAKKG
ncbi:hypothetical protein ACFQPG_10140 [Sphingomonas sp. GCM10030256]|uniref:hypothetical protein n=1 Tax=Sphingomonas sp. GCM10030256 TaxID=3273427 RepID=UPI0036206C33